MSLIQQVIRSQNMSTVGKWKAGAQIRVKNCAPAFFWVALTAKSQFSTRQHHLASVVKCCNFADDAYHPFRNKFEPGIVHIKVAGGAGDCSEVDGTGGGGVQGILRRRLR